MNRRLETLQNTLPEGIDAALIGSPVNRRYYTGLASSAGVLFVTREHAELLIDFRYIEAARAAADGYTVTLQEALGTQLHALAVTHGVETVGVETGTLTLDEFALYREWMGEVQISTDCALNKAILRQRSRKSAEEIEQMQRAQDITDRCFLELLNFIRAGVSEREVANELARLIRQCGAERESFETIAVSGQKTSMPHGQPSDKLIGRGELFTLD
ncbi:MAG: aminopeptidase P family N-terminal domain-containing protein, partial [Oscillospiraceae bacterium]